MVHQRPMVFPFDRQQRGADGEVFRTTDSFSQGQGLVWFCFLGDLGSFSYLTHPSKGNDLANPSCV